MEQNFPVKQGGIAAQQADAAAEAIAANMGVPVTPAPFRPTLRGVLLSGIAPTYLRAQIAGTSGDSFEIAANPLWWPPSKIAGRYLAPYLAGHSPLTRDETLEDRPPSTEEPARLEQSHADVRALAINLAERDAADRHFKSGTAVARGDRAARRRYCPLDIWTREPTGNIALVGKRLRVRANGGDAPAE